jgi:hypothetical protein
MWTSRRSAQCGRDFVFTAAEQKHWYETLKFHFDSTAIRCVECRRQRRNAVALHARVGEAKRALAAHPDEPTHQLALARALVTLREATGGGDLAEMVAAARGAQRDASLAAVGLYCEAVAHEMAGRRAKAVALFERLVARFADRAKDRAIVKAAERKLAQWR